MKLTISDYLGCTFVGLLMTMATAVCALLTTMLFTITDWAPDFMLDYRGDARMLFRVAFLCWPFVTLHLIRGEYRRVSKIQPE